MEVFTYSAPTMYQFPKRLLSEEELEGLGISDGDTHLEGMKRYSQFDKFHSSLLKTPMATHLKGIHNVHVHTYM